MMERIERESLWLFCPDLADVFVGGEAFECLKPLGEIVSANEVSEMAAKLAMGLVVEPLNGSILDGAVHALDLAVGPRVFGLGEAMINVILRASEFEGVSEEDLMPIELGLDLGRSPAVSAWLSEVGAIVGQNRVDFVRNGFDNGFEEVRGDAPGRLFMQLDKGEL